MRISKATREAASNICNARASWWETSVVDRYMDTPEARRLFSVGAEALAQAAHGHAWECDATNSDRWLMAEALIRDGWTP